MTSYRQSMKDTLELMNLMREASLLERELTPDEEKRREEIAKDLPDDDFKKRYGDQWMQVKMATATNMVKKEEVDLDEAKFSAKEIKMAIGIASDKRYKGGNMTGAADAIDKIKPGLSDHPQVRAVLRRQNEETELDEVGGSAFGGTIDKIQKVVDDKQAMKIDGVMVDTFTASLIMNIFNKVNKQNQDKMRKMKVTQLANAAYKLAGVKEEVELDEAKMSASQIATLKKAYEPMRGKKISMDSGKKLSSIMDKVDDDKQALIQLVKADIPFVSQLAITRLISKHDMKGAEIRKMQEEVELEQGKPIVIEEGKMGDQWQKGAKSVKSGPFELMRGKSGVHAIMQNGKKLGDFSYDDDADNFVANMKGMKGQWVGNDIDSLINHLQKVHKEEVELDEKVKEYKGVAYFKDRKDAEAHMKKFAPKGRVREYDRGYAIQTKIAGPYLNKSGKVEEQVEIEEASASADARRAMRRDPDMLQRAFSKDDDATDDDKKAASKNIMMQMRKAQSLKGRFDVEFQDGKKVKIPAKMAIAVQQKYNAMRKPADKEKFQSKVGKSYRDMLNALKEAVSPAQQAAIAISKKERGEKPKKESILDRIDRKIKENKNG